MATVTHWTQEWLRRLDTELAELSAHPANVQREIRRTLAQDPVAFAIIYLSKHLTGPSTGGRLTLSPVHLEWAGHALRWCQRDQEPQDNRHAFIAPREMGKSTWHFLVLPLWAAANRHRTFVAAFAHSTAQAETHLQTFKMELDTNPLLRADYPDLCTPARRPTGQQVADRAGMLHCRSGFVFAARGIDSATLGLKVGDQRPDLLIFDDVEPDEASYSPLLAEKRLGTITDAAFPLNIYAAVTMVGTVTMPGSIMHQCVKAALGHLEPGEADWIADEKIQPHYHAPILTADDGTERSVWPEKWSLEFLQSIRHTRSFAKNYLNDPMGRDGAFWTMDDFRYGRLDPPPTRWILQLDPAVTTKGTSDYTGWAVVAYRPPMRGAVDRTLDHVAGRPDTPGMVEVVDAGRVRLAGENLRAWVLRMLAKYSRIRYVRVEVNQGGELWHTVLHSLPVKLLVHTSTEAKEVRFAWALDYYQTGGGRVLHRTRLRTAEEEMVAFPKAAYDDTADAVVSGVLFFLQPPKVVRSTATTNSYV
jgi:hypothetical protein